MADNLEHGASPGSVREDAKSGAPEHRNELRRDAAPPPPLSSREQREPAGDQRLFAADLDKFYRVMLHAPRPPWRARLRLWATHAGLHCVAIYRLDRFAQRLRKRRKVLGWALSAASIALRTGMEMVHHVEIGAEIGPGFFLGHAGNIFIGPTRIGRNFSATHNVTVGVGNNPHDHGLPTIGDDVWVGTGSVLAGKINVGDGATISHGTMLTRDVPKGALAGGNPGRVIIQGYDNAKLLGVGPGATATD